jgi:rfaE bifunctional protein nucleotidyltransferase chain/domain
MSVVTPGRVQPRAGRASDMVGGPSLHAPSYFEVRHARAWLEACRADATVVLAHGCFDVLHVGHLHHLNQARTMGNILIVSVTDDQFVSKGPHRPVQSAPARAELLAALAVVDRVVITRATSAVATINALRPDVFVKGAGYAPGEADHHDPRLHAEIDAAEAIGGRVEFTDARVVDSSTRLVQRIREEH